MSDIKSSDVTPELVVTTVDVVNGETKSAAINLKAHRLHSFATPDSLSATDITFEASYNGTDYFPVRTASGAYTIPSAQVQPSTIYVPDFATFFGFQFVKIVLGAAPNGVRTFTIGAVPR